MTERRAPPGYVPTLTEVVQPSPVPAQQLAQRLEALIAQRVGPAAERLVEEQAAALAPLLRARVEAIVREAVAEALAQELGAAAARAATPSPPRG